jgi:hypothetical protein
MERSGHHTCSAIAAAWAITAAWPAIAAAGSGPAQEATARLSDPSASLQAPEEAPAPEPETPQAPATVEAPGGVPAPAPADAAPGKRRSKFIAGFYDDTDGKFDFSKVLAKGGFIPMPVVITEPAVDGGFGVVAQFVSLPKDRSGEATRRMVGAFRTGNGSYGLFYVQSGAFEQGRYSYRFGVAHGKVTLDAISPLLPSGVKYTNSYDYAIFGTLRVHLADRRFSLGPILDFRRLSSRLDFPGVPEELAPDFDRKLTTGALGFGLHFDSRNNKISPTDGVNAYFDSKFNSGAFGSDRTFQLYDLETYAFRTLSPQWRLGLKVVGNAARGDYPYYFAPAINLRGVEAQHFQGNTVLSTEAEVVRQLSSRWSVVAFAGFGEAYAGNRHIFSDSGAIFAGGGGIRYRIARLLGLDAGLDVAAGPNGTVFYLQFGHAWSFGMD